MTPLRTVGALRRGSAFLASIQQADGGFNSFSSPSQAPFKPQITYKTTFTPALILAALSAIDNPLANSMRKKLAAWLLLQKSPAWSFNYWATSAPQCTAMPYPDDLDDTFCALTALYLHDPSIIDEACLGKVVKLLIATEEQVGGPYRTWLVKNNEVPQIWQDVDLAVNSNIAFFINMVAEPLPNLNNLMESAIAAQKFYSPYYPSAYPILYYLARSYRGSQANELARYILKCQRRGWWGTPLQTALAVSALARLGYINRCGAAVSHLLEYQRKDGSWRAESFCLDPAIKNQKYFNGSDALTTAFALEAIGLYSRRRKVVPTPPCLLSDPVGNRLQSQLYNTAKKAMNGLGADLKRQYRPIIEQTIRRDDRREITLLPYFFNNSLITPVSLERTELFIHLGLANLYGWTAYTIYDDFLDGEGEPKLLPAANTALRCSLKEFRRALPANELFQNLVEQTFGIIDSANAWELAHCRAKTTSSSIIISHLPKYGNTLNLANRSLGHTLTPLGVLAEAGVQPDNPRAILVWRALRHYIAARQLNDDLHDWEEDLRAGIITYVVAAILAQMSVPPGEYAFASLIPDMQRQFWHSTLNSVCAAATSHTNSARRDVRASGLLLEENIINRLVGRLDESVKSSLHEQGKAKQFLAAYTESAS
ncbi:MAG TPA: prenyltransferase/squalene oxidase repeat-containing protein [Candidatus Saccharimonadales bacterium]